MLIVLAILSIGLLGIIIFFAFSQKSSRLLKLASLGALGLIGLTLGICAIFLIIGPAEETEEFLLPFFSDAPQQQQQPQHANVAESIVFFAIFLGIMCVIAVLAIKEHRNKGVLPAKPEPKPVFANPGNTGSKPTEKEDKKDDNEFDIGLDF